MNPLMVECSVSKQIDALLAHLHIVTGSQFLSYILLKVLVGVDYQFSHKLINNVF